MSLARFRGKEYKFQEFLKTTFFNFKVLERARGSSVKIFSQNQTAGKKKSVFFKQPDRQFERQMGK